MSSLAEVIRTRVSVRTYEDRPLAPEDRADLEAFIESISTPFDVPVTFHLLDPATHGLKSPVIVGAKLYVAAKVPRAPQADLACGYAFECLCLHAAARGIGTVMLAGTLNRKAFEHAMEVGTDEVMPVASPLGYPAAKRSLRETAMRKAIKADERLAFEELFFADSFDTPLTPEAAGTLAEPLELLRRAPSAANKQPWRAIVSGTCVHFYEAKSTKDNALGDIQKVDMGIALAHFDLARKEAGTDGAFVVRDPGITLPASTEYIISFDTVS